MNYNRYVMYEEDYSETYLSLIISMLMKEKAGKESQVEAQVASMAAGMPCSVRTWMINEWSKPGTEAPWNSCGVAEPALLVLAMKCLDAIAGRGFEAISKVRQSSPTFMTRKSPLELLLPAELEFGQVKVWLLDKGPFAGQILAISTEEIGEFLFALAARDGGPSFLNQPWLFAGVEVSDVDEDKDVMELIDDDQFGISRSKKSGKQKIRTLEPCSNGYEQYYGIPKGWMDLKVCGPTEAGSHDDVYDFDRVPLAPVEDWEVFTLCMIAATEAIMMAHAAMHEACDELVIIRQYLNWLMYFGVTRADETQRARYPMSASAEQAEALFRSAADAMAGLPVGDIKQTFINFHLHRTLSGPSTADFRAARDWIFQSVFVPDSGLMVANEADDMTIWIRRPEEPGFVVVGIKSNDETFLLVSCDANKGHQWTRMFRVSSPEGSSMEKRDDALSVLGECFTDLDLIRLSSANEDGKICISKGNKTVECLCLGEVRQKEPWKELDRARFKYERELCSGLIATLRFMQHDPEEWQEA